MQTFKRVLAMLLFAFCLPCFVDENTIQRVSKALFPQVLRDTLYLAMTQLCNFGMIAYTENKRINEWQYVPIRHYKNFQMTAFGLQTLVYGFLWCRIRCIG